MSLFSNLLETYNKCSAAVGITQVDSVGKDDDSKTFLPLFHTTFKSQICVTLDKNGTLIKIDRDKKDQTIIIPCTEKSSSRSSGIAPHPLCDQLAYVDKNLDSDKFKSYLSQLRTWKDNDKKLEAIYAFLSSNSIVEELKKADLFIESEKQKDGELIKDKIAKIGVRFSVQIPGDYYANIWEDINIQNVWINLQSQSETSINKGFDYISGDNINILTQSHPKNINSSEANAKLISCNDNAGFTYKGRFTCQDDAIQIDSLSSQKVHQTLRWLIKNYSYFTASQVIVIWAVDSNVEEKIRPFLSSYDMNNELFGEMESVKTDIDIIHETEAKLDKNYSKMLAASLRGYGNVSNMKNHSKEVVILILDAATTGRLGVTFYQELFENEYIENIAKWHEESAWHLLDTVKVINSNGKENYKQIRYIGCPSLEKLIETIYGKPRSKDDKSYLDLKKKVQKQLLECMFGNFAFPKSLVDMATYRVSRPMSFTNEKGSFDEFNWKCSLEIACSLIKKYIKQQKKEEIAMELEELRDDRDYLFGRLLAVADRIEQRAMYIADKSDQRSTNALRLMNSFAVKPYSTWGVLWSQLNPYVNQLQGAGYFVSIINEIMSLFKSGEYENNKPLSPLYLLGYSHQIRALFTKKND